MAVVKLLCGECGAPVTPADRTCRVCGAGVELPRLENPASPPEDEVRCPVCGHRNAPGSTVCGSCGARVGTASRPAPSRAAKPKSTATRAAASGPRKFEPWQVVSAGAVLILLAYVVFVLVSDRSPKQETHSAVPAAMPPTMSPQAQKTDTAPYELAVRENPGDPGALLRLANVLHDNGEFTRAIETYRKYLSKDPGNPDARTDMGICYFELAKSGQGNIEENYKRALEEMERAFKANPNHQSSAFNLGIVYLNKGDLEKSNRWLKQAVAINEHSELGHRAQTLLSQHSFTP
jgi:cytochrome c-type biogenesis protein CcmH/NrfG